MPARPLLPVDDVTPADWLVAAVPEFGGRVEQLLPAGYPAYLRIFHRPDQGLPDAEDPATWAAVAAHHGTVLHAEAQWSAVTRGEDQPGTPLVGSLDRLTLPRLAEHLARHTTTPERCHLAHWEGHGTAPSTWEAHPRFALPGRTHWLLPPVHVTEVPACAVELSVGGLEDELRRDGELRSLMVFGRRKRRGDSRDFVAAMRRAGDVQSPSWWWPEDRAWVVLSETDYDSTLVGADVALAEALLADPEIECLPIEPGGSLFFDADTVNGG